MLAVMIGADLTLSGRGIATGAVSPPGQSAGTTPVTALPAPSAAAPEAQKRASPAVNLMERFKFRAPGNVSSFKLTRNYKLETRNLKLEIHVRPRYDARVSGDDACLFAWW